MSQSIFLVVSLSLLISNAAGLEAESIIGGKVAQKNQFPYQVSLQLGGSNVCGGSLIAPDLVLTAAHCVTFNNRVPRIPYSVLVGATDLVTGRGKRIDVAKIYAHGGFTELNDGSVVNDIAVLRLAEKLNVRDNSAVGIVDLPDSDDTFSGKTAVISGFGWDKISVKVNRVSNSLKRTGDSERLLKFAQVRVLSNFECGDRISSHICGQIIKQYRSTQQRGVCTGDSGGPLVHENKVIGIVSYGIAICDEAYRPTVYTRVSSFLDFIRGAMADRPISNTRVVTIRHTSENRPKVVKPSNYDDDEDDSAMIEIVKATLDDMFGRGSWSIE